MITVGEILFQKMRLYNAIRHGLWTARERDYLDGRIEWWDGSWQFGEFKYKLSLIGVDSKLDRSTLKELVFVRFNIEHDNLTRSFIKLGKLERLRNFLYDVRPYCIHRGIPIFRANAYGIIGKSKLLDASNRSPLKGIYVVGRSDACLFECKWDEEREYYMVVIVGPVMPDESRVQPTLRRAKLAANKISSRVSEWDAHRICVEARPDLFKRPVRNRRPVKIPEEDLQTLRLFDWA